MAGKHVFQVRIREGSASVAMAGLVDSKLESMIPTVQVGGELDGPSSAAVREVMRNLGMRGHLKVALDLTDVSHLDDDGMRVLVRTFEEQRSRRGQCRIVAASPRVRRVLEIRGLDYMMGGGSASAQRLSSPNRKPR